MVKNLNINSLNCVKLNKAQVHKIVSNIKKELNFNIASLLINFVNSDYIIGINKEFLGHNYSTDIITFNYSDINDTLSGEIFISITDAADNANKYNVSKDNEILRLIIHGILHLLGFDDIKKDDKRRMKIQENELVNKLNDLGKNIIIKYDC